MSRNYKNHRHVKTAKAFIEKIEAGEISTYEKKDYLLLRHLVLNPVGDYAVLKMFDETLSKYVDELKRLNISFTPLSKDIPTDARAHGYIQITLNGNIMEMRLPFLRREKFLLLIDEIKNFGMQFNKSSELWWIFVRDKNILNKILSGTIVNEIGYKIDRVAQKTLMERIEDSADTEKELLKLSSAATTEIDKINGFVGTLYPFQKVTVAYSEKNNTIFIADEMGLGKTIQSLAILQKHNLYPALVVSPGHLKKNWISESNRFLPDRTVHILETGKKIIKADIYVISYGSVETFGEGLKIVPFKSVILDECFVYDTKIETDRGLLNIGYIVENRLPIKVLSKNKNGYLEYKPIVNWYEYKKEENTIILRIKLQNELFIDVTPNHNIYFGDKYVRADEIRVGDELFVLRKEINKETDLIKVRVENIEILELGHRQGYNGCEKENRYVYDIGIKDNHNYFANNILVSNSHFIKNHKANRTKAVQKYLKYIPFKMLLTGTPILNRPLELVSQLDFLDVLKTHFGGRWRFIQRYAPPTSNGYYTEYGADNLEELQLELRKSCMVRRMKADVLKELPDKQKQVVFLELSDYNAYREVEWDMMAWYETQLKKSGDLSQYEIKKKVLEKRRAQNPLAEKLVKLNYLKQAATEYKLISVYKWIDNVLSQTDKLVIFAHHKFVMKALADKYKKISVVLNEESSKNAKELETRFQTEPNIKLFIGSLMVASVGLTLTASNKVAFVELGWNPSIHQQAEDRVHRIGQTMPVNIYYLLGSDTIDEYLYAMIVEKGEVIDKATNIDKIFEQLLKKKQ